MLTKEQVGKIIELTEDLQDYIAEEIGSETISVKVSANEIKIKDSETSEKLSIVH